MQWTLRNGEKKEQTMRTALKKSGISLRLFEEYNFVGIL